MENISVEVILFGVLIIVIVLDVIIKGRRKKSQNDDKSAQKKINNYKEKVDSKNPSYLIKFLIERPRNIGVYFLFMLILKVLINVLIFPKYWQYGVGFVEYDDPKILDKMEQLGLYDTRKLNFVEYIEYIFQMDLFIFGYSFIIVSFIAWQLYPYLKKR